MIQYVSVIEDGSNRPRLMKQIIDNDSVQMSIAVSPANVDDLREVPRDVYMQHMENLLGYIKESADSTALPDPAQRVETIWPIVGWDAIHTAAVELSDFWYWLSLNTESSTIEQE